MNVISEERDTSLKSPFLATTSIEEFWDTSRPILFLGEWCLLFDRDEIRNHPDFRVLPYPWDAPEQKRQAATHCLDLFERALPCLGRYLNRVHGEKWNLRYWRLIIGPWLLHYIQALYDRYVCLRDAFEDEPGLDTIALSQESWVTPSDWGGYAHLIQEDGYNLQLYTQIFSSMGKEFSARRYSIPEEGPGSPRTCGQKLKRHSRNGYKWLLDGVGSGRRVLLYDLAMELPDVWKISRATGFHAWPMIRSAATGKSHGEPIDKNIRRELESLPLTEKIEGFPNSLLHTLPVNFPRLYLEGYPQMRRSVAPFCKGKQKVLVSTFGWKSNERFKFIAADASERGARLVGTQHGAGTGTSIYSPMDEFIQQEVDSFITIGQLKDEVPRAVNLPDPKFQRLRREKPATKNREPGLGDILFVGNSYPRYATSFRTQPISSQMVAYMDWQSRFFSSIPAGLRRKTLVRLYPFDYGWKSELRLGEKCTDLDFDDCSVGISQRMENCRLLVTDNPQTTFLEALASNVPTILFFEPMLWQMRHRAKGAFDRFREAGVVHYDPESAAGFVKEIEGDILGWWEKDSVQEACREFLNWQVLEEPGWVDAWRKALLDWSRSSTRPGAATEGAELPEQESRVAETGKEL